MYNSHSLYLDHKVIFYICNAHTLAIQCMSAQFAFPKLLMLCDAVYLYYIYGIVMFGGFVLQKIWRFTFLNENTLAKCVKPNLSNKKHVVFHSSGGISVKHNQGMRLWAYHYFNFVLSVTVHSYIQTSCKQADSDQICNICSFSPAVFRHTTRHEPVQQEASSKKKMSDED